MPGGAQECQDIDQRHRRAQADARARPGRRPRPRRPHQSQELPRPLPHGPSRDPNPSFLFPSAHARFYHLTQVSGRAVYTLQLSHYTRPPTREWSKQA